MASAHCCQCHGISVQYIRCICVKKKRPYVLCLPSKSNNCQNTLSRRQHTTVYFDNDDTCLSDFEVEISFRHPMLFLWLIRIRSALLLILEPLRVETLQLLIVQTMLYSIYFQTQPCMFLAIRTIVRSMWKAWWKEHLVNHWFIPVVKKLLMNGINSGQRW